MRTQLQGEVEREVSVGYRLGLYDPVSGTLLKYVSRTFSDSPEDAQLMNEVVRDYNAWSASARRTTLCLGAFRVGEWA